jgi:hypothetical protein
MPSSPPAARPRSSIRAARLAAQSPYPYLTGYARSIARAATLNTQALRTRRRELIAVKRAKERLQRRRIELTNAAVCLSHYHSALPLYSFVPQMAAYNAAPSINQVTVPLTSDMVSRLSTLV